MNPGKEEQPTAALLCLTMAQANTKLAHLLKRALPANWTDLRLAVVSHVSGEPRFIGAGTNESRLSTDMADDCQA